jgi:hypothetical protein
MPFVALALASLLAIAMPAFSQDDAPAANTNAAGADDGISELPEAMQAQAKQMLAGTPLLKRGGAPALRPHPAPHQLLSAAGAEQRPRGCAWGGGAGLQAHSGWRPAALRCQQQRSAHGKQRRHAT